MQIVSIGDNVNEMLNPVFLEISEKCHQFVVANLVQRMVKIIFFNETWLMKILLWIYLFLFKNLFIYFWKWVDDLRNRVMPCKKEISGHGRMPPALFCKIILSFYFYDLRWMDAPVDLVAIFHKGDNFCDFLSASLHISRERICP